MKAKPNKTKLKKDCDKLWSQIIRQRDGKCLVDGCTNESLHAHHIFSRRHLGTRWLPITNGVSLCFYHHKYWAHVDYEDFRKFVIDCIGEVEYYKLYTLSKLATHYKIPDLLEIKEHLKSILNQMEG